MKKKYIAISITMISLAFFMTIPVSADTLTDSCITPLASVDDFVDTLKSIWELIQNFYEAITTPMDEFLKEVLTTIVNNLKEETNAALLLLSDSLSSGSNDYFLNNYYIVNKANSIMMIIKPFSATISGIAWSVGVIKTMLHYDDNNPRMWLTWFCGIMINTSFVNSSFGICQWVVNEETRLVDRVLGTANWYMAIDDIDITAFSFKAGLSEVPLLGWMWELLIAFAQTLPALIALLALMIISLMVYIKLIVRQLEIVCMICVSPLFFGCLISEVSRPWFKNFLGSFLGVVFETLFMAISLTIGVGFVNARAQEVNSIMEYTTVVITVVAVAFTCLKPPRALTNLVKA